MWSGWHPTRNLKPRRDGAPWLIWICSEDTDVQRDTLQQKFTRFIPQEWIEQHYMGRSNAYNNSILKIPNRIYGTQELHITWKQYAAGVDSFESASVDHAILDEEPPKTIYGATVARLVDSKSWGNGYLSCAMSPTKMSKENWSIPEIYEKWKDGTLNTKLWFVTQFSIYDNAENLGGKEGCDEIVAGYPEDERPARCYGDPQAKGGHIISRFIDQKYPAGHLLVPHQPDWDVCTPYECIDYGFSDPMAIGFYYAHQEGYHVKYAELYLKNHTIPQTKSLIYKMRKEYGYTEPRMVWIDPTARNRESNGISKIQQFTSKEMNVWAGMGAEPTEAVILNAQKKVRAGKLTQQEFQVFRERFLAREGYISMSIPVAQAVSNKHVGWDVLNEWLRFDQKINRPKLFITENCVNTRREFKALRWGSHKDGKVDVKKIIGDDHSSDETRYYVNSDPVYVKGFTVKPKNYLREKARRVKR